MTSSYRILTRAGYVDAMPIAFRPLTTRLASFRVIRVVTMALGTATGAVDAQPSPRLPLGDAAYVELDQLVGSGLVRTVMYGQRPFTRREVTRIVADASRAAERRTVSDATRRVLDRLRRRFQVRPDADSASAAPYYASVETVQLQSPARAIARAPVGDVAADLNPLLNGRGGRWYSQGMTLSAEGGGAWSLGRRVTLQLAPRIAAGRNANSGERFAMLSLQDASVSISGANLVLDVGRQPLAWGQGMDGGLMLSSSGRPLDMIRVSTDRPWRAPWVFKWLGLLRGTAFIADLGPRQNFPNAKIAAYKLSGQVTSYFELAAQVLVHQGGRGAPPASLVDRFVDLVPALQYSLPRKNTTQFSNKLAGWEERVRIPQLHGLQLYAEHAFDDMDPRRWRSTLWEDAGHIVGASLAQIGPAGAYSLATEFHHTGLRFYRHTPFVSGLAFDGVLLGDPLGPQGDGGTIRLRYDAGRRQSWQVDATVERRGGDVWGTTSDSPADERFRFVLLRAQPAEWRTRTMLRWAFLATPVQRLSLEAGMERVRDAGFIRGARRTNTVAAAQWSWSAW